MSNLNFEILENETAKGWETFGNGTHEVSFDPTIFQNGNVSRFIKSIDNKDAFKALSYKIPADFGGKNIKLSGYIKTENVTGGWAGLWMRIDPHLAFDNMISRGITGTTDWKKYEIELDLNSSSENIVVGGLLSGSGKIWIDNLSITVDGMSLDKAPEKILTLAQKTLNLIMGQK